MTIEELKAYGADTDAGLQRCMNNESFYLRLVKMIPGDDNFRKLKEALEGGNLDAAFEAAHALKPSWRPGTGCRKSVGSKQHCAMNNE